MSKRYWLYILIIIVIIITVWGIKSNSKSSLSKENSFHIEDPSSITKIFLADRNGNTITLKKTRSKWTINNEFDVRNDAISTLLSTANKIRIKKPVSKTAFEKVVKFIATTGVYVEFFENKKKVKAYFIGSNTPDHSGTYMLLSGQDRPFVTHIPHFNGFLSPRYGIQSNAIDLRNWRSTTVFNLTPNSISYLKYTNYINPETSYSLETNPVNLINYKNQPIPFNYKKIIKLLNSFKDLNCETYKKEEDKIKIAKQLEELIVNSDTLRTYRISRKEDKSKTENFTVTRKYAKLNNGEVMLIQDYVFNKVLINITELSK